MHHSSSLKCPSVFFPHSCDCSADTEDVCIVERLFSSSLVAIVSLKAPRKLKVCHFKKGTEICNYSYSNTILAVKLNRQVSEQWFYLGGNVGKGVVDLTLALPLALPLELLFEI